MSILEKLKSYLSLFQNIQKEDEPEDYATRFERLHRNGRSDEEWEAKKHEHPGLFGEPSFNHVGRTHEESRISEILGRNGLSDEEWEAKKRRIRVYSANLKWILFLNRIMQKKGFLKELNFF
ncbi:hypothetical protein [uncultured Methanobrevibacter sp.]|uniref:hypothetical protein n=1 Tax=uncultured Methanobrevibacter sp. TaxID=253161 RepID=UPI0025E64493|nr:hypothetical protein [uncultured Methanobrevibacter sp.]